MKQENHRYDDILYRSRPVSRRPKMSGTARGAQFSAFAALSGFDEVIEKSSQRGSEPVWLGEDAAAALDEQLRKIARAPEAAGIVTFLCFQRDAAGRGGAYVPVTGRVKRVDPAQQTVVLENGETIFIDSIYRIAAGVP